MAIQNYHIDDVNVLGDLQIDFKFLVTFNFNSGDTFSKITAALNADGIETPQFVNVLDPNADTVGNSTAFTAYARSITFPGRQSGTLTDHYQGWQTRYPGKMSWNNSFQVTFAERQSGAILRSIQAWQELINNTAIADATGSGHSFQTGGDFKNGTTNLTATLELTMLTTDGQASSVSGYYYNVWPSNRNEVQLSMESEGFVKPSITFAYDWSEIHKSGQPYYTAGT